MSLPWVRLDSNIASHEKITRMLHTEPVKGYRAAFVYCCSLGHCGGHGTDGLIDFTSLPFIHARKMDAEMLVRFELWTPDPLGWRLKNWALRQELSVISDMRKEAQAKGARKANCKRWHGPDCGCWEQAA